MECGLRPCHELSRIKYGSNRIQKQGHSESQRIKYGVLGVVCAELHRIKYGGSTSNHIELNIGVQEDLKLAWTELYRIKNSNWNELARIKYWVQALLGRIRPNQNRGHGELQRIKYGGLRWPCTESHRNKRGV